MSENGTAQYIYNLGRSCVKNEDALKPEEKKVIRDAKKIGQLTFMDFVKEAHKVGDSHGAILLLLHKRLNDFDRWVIRWIHKADSFENYKPRNHYSER